MVIFHCYVKLPEGTYHPQMVALVLDLSEVKTEQIKVEIQNQA